MSLQRSDHNDLFDFTGSVGRNGENGRADVIKAQMLLANAGALDLPDPGVPTGWAGEGLHRAIGRFQRDNGLAVDGVLLPMPGGKTGSNGEGETLRSLQDLLGGRMQDQIVPTPGQVDSFFESYARDPYAGPGFRLPVARDDTSLITKTMEMRYPPWAEPQLHMQLRSASDVENEPAAPPDAAQQEAMLPIAAAPFLLAPLAIGAGEYLRQQYEKNRRENFIWSPESPVLPPSRPANDAERAQTAIPPLQPPEPDGPLQGRPAADRTPDGERLIPPDIKKWVSSLPPEQQPLADELAGIIVETHEFGSRGNPRTEEATTIVTRVCLDQLQARPDLAGKLFHVAGSYKDGQGGEDRRLTEEWVPRQDAKDVRGSEKLKGGVHVDSTFGPKLEDENEVSPYWARMQTVDFSKRADEHDPEGRYKREKEADARLLQNMESGVSEWARKMRPGETAEEYAAYAAIRCGRMWDKLEARLRRDGHLPAR